MSRFAKQGFKKGTKKEQNPQMQAKNGKYVSLCIAVAFNDFFLSKRFALRIGKIRNVCLGFIDQ